MMAKKKPMEQKSPSELNLKEDEIGEAGAKIQIIKLQLPPKRVAGTIVEGEPQETAKKLTEWLQKEAKLL